MVRTILNRAGIVNGRQEKEGAWPGAPPGVRATCYSSPFALHCWHAPQRIPFIVAELGRDADPFIAIAEGTSPYRSKPTRTSFDHLVRAQQDRGRQLDPERLGGLEVDHHLVFGPRLLAFSRH
jgi:hypothetical protein